MIVYKRQIGWDSVMRMSADLQDLFLYEAFLYYNPLLLVVSAFCLVIWSFVLWAMPAKSWCSSYVINLILQTMMVWLWGVNLWVFAQSTVNYAKIFDLDHNHLTHQEIWKVLEFYVSKLIMESFVMLTCFLYFSIVFPRYMPLLKVYVSY